MKQTDLYIASRCPRRQQLLSAGNEHSLQRRLHLDRSTCTRVNTNEEGGVANDDDVIDGKTGKVVLARFIIITHNNCNYNGACVSNDYQMKLFGGQCCDDGITPRKTCASDKMTVHMKSADKYYSLTANVELNNNNGVFVIAAKAGLIQ